jgi:aspartate/methionine/tyrosine aminotransferase
LASSTGPRWSVDDLVRLGNERLSFDDVVLAYAPPQGTAALREAVAAFHNVDPDWVVMTTGASEALSILLCLASRSGANIVIPDPAYPAYAAIAQTSGLTTLSYAMESPDGFVQSPDAILAAATDDTIAVILNTPHNPTGVVMERSAVQTLAAALADRSILLLVDEVYHPLYFDGPQQSVAGIPNVIVMSDLSKAMSLPGLRTGWIIDSDPHRREKSIDARSYFTISGSPLLERLATHALIHRQTILSQLQRVAEANLGLLGALIEGSSGRLAWTHPQGGTTCFPWFTDRRDSRPFCQKLADAGVLVAPGDCFGHSSHMRIGFAQQVDGFGEAVRRIAAML